jgi:hypothetical protein
MHHGHPDVVLAVRVRALFFDQDPGQIGIAQHPAHARDLEEAQSGVASHTPVRQAGDPADPPGGVGDL